MNQGLSMKIKIESNQLHQPFNIGSNSTSGGLSARFRNLAPSLDSKAKLRDIEINNLFMRKLWSIKRIVFILLLELLLSPAWSLNLYAEESYRPLIADRKASLPGDLLTVIVLETSNAQTSADLSSGKNIKAALDAGYNNDKHQVEFGLASKGRAAAQTARNGKIKASLTVQVKEVFPNSTYLVEGLQTITINGEQQQILLSGVVRPEDISPQNTILSTRLADAHIRYAGNGSVSDSQTRNYFYKILSFVGVL